jgi:hypothetical protein
MRGVGQPANRVAAALCGVGAVVLFASTFLHWYPPAEIEGAYFNRSVGAPAYAGSFSSDGWANAWQAFAVVDLLLMLCVLAALAAAILLLRRPSLQAAAWVAVGAGLAGLALVLWRTIDEPDDIVPSGLGVGIGPVVAAAALVGVAAGGIVAAATARPASAPPR